MKKLLLIAASTALLSSAAYAKEDVYSVEVSVGGTMLQRDKLKFMVDDYSTKLKSKAISPVLSFGIGYGVMDNFRTVLEYSHYFKPEHKGTYSEKTDMYSSVERYKQKLHIDSLMLKGIVDAFEAGPAKFFVGAGVGMAKVKQNVHFSETLTAGSASINFKPKTYKSKNKNNFAYTVLAGASYEVSTGVNLDLTYSFSDFGKTKPLSDQGENISNKAKVQAHDVKLGLRFDI